MRKLLFILLLCITTSASGQFFAPNQKPMLGLQVNGGHPQSKGLAGLWFFNENSGGQVFDLSGNGNDGILTGTAPSWGSGKFGSAVLFPGTDEYILISPEIYQTTEVTRIAWIKLNSYVSRRPIFGGDGADRSDFEIFGTGDHKLRLYCYDLSNPGWHSGPVLLLNVWYQVAFTYGGGTLRLYVNGKIELEVNGLTGNIGDLDFIGYYSLSYFDGLIDHAMIYNRALSASEIAQLYREPFCFMQPSWNWVLYNAITVTPTGQVIFINQ